MTVAVVLCHMDGGKLSRDLSLDLDVEFPDPLYMALDVSRDVKWTDDPSKAHNFKSDEEARAHYNRVRYELGPDHAHFIAFADIFFRANGTTGRRWRIWP